MDKLKGYYCYIYIALWMMYYLQDMLMIVGVVAQMILVALMAISFYAFYEVNVHYKTCSYLKWLNVMLVVLTIYGFISIIGEWTLNAYKRQEIASYIYLRNIYRSVMPIYAFYYFSQKRQISKKNITNLFVALFLFSILAYYQQFILVSELFGKERVTNNMGYFFVPLIPMLQFLKIRDAWKYLILIVILIFIMSAMKRGAILTGAAMLMLFLYNQFKGISVKKTSYILILTSVVLLSAYKYTSNLYDHSSYFKSRVNQTKKWNSSNRDEIYTKFYDYFVNRTTPTEYLVGNGMNATYILFGVYAHNDWLEFAICQGILGVMMYLIYWIFFFMEWKNYRGPTNCRQVLESLMIAYFMISLYSMSIDNMPIVATLCIGYCLAVSTGQKQREIVKRELIIRERFQ